MRVRRTKVPAKSVRQEIIELKENYLELSENVDLLMQSRDVFPECTCLKETSKGRDLIGMLEGEVSDLEAFRQRIMNG